MKTENIDGASKTKLLIATSNQAKLADFKLYLNDDYTVLGIDDIGIKLKIPEGIDSIEDNAIAKARAYAVKTGLMCLGDDTGFFIEELNGEPGVALRRWGGELPEETTGEEFWDYLQQKTRGLKNLDCYFKQCIAIASPSGEIRVVHNVNNGVLNRVKLQQPYNGTDYPLAAAFESRDRKKTWDEMTDDEKRAFDKDFIRKLKQTIAALS
jgi:Ham1 family protein